MATIEQRVKRGVKLLDATCLEWRERVNVATLDEGSLYQGTSVLEQVYGRFHDGIHALGLRGHWADYGFDIIGEEWNEEGNLTGWRDLTETWKHELTK